MNFNLIQADVLEGLRSLPNESVQCCITSPPYWGLRDYGTAKWEGGEAECDHKKVSPGSASIARSTLEGGQLSNGHQQEGFKSHCGKCGATRIDSQIGLERTPKEYVSRIVEVFREVRRVLKDDATVWLNLGDSYAGHNLPGWRDGNEVKNGGASNKNGCGYVRGLKPKDLVGIPWRVAFALQADGWWLRSEIIWEKRNPMPESVRDRPTKSHEQIFLLAKSERYFYDAEAIQESTVCSKLPGPNLTDTRLTYGSQNGGNSGLRDLRREYIANGIPNLRNKRSVWTIATQPYPDAHFATFPEELVKPCILAGCPEGGTVLDPFCGSGTAGVVAMRFGRDFIGIDLCAEYIRMARRRLNRVQPLFCSEAEAEAVDIDKLIERKTA